MMGPLLISLACLPAVLPLLSQDGQHREGVALRLGDPTPASAKGIRAVAFSPGSRYIATGVLDGHVVLWNGRTGERIRTLAKPPEGNLERLQSLQQQGCSVSFSPDGTRVAAALAINGIRIWETQTGKEVCRIGDPGLTGKSGVGETRHQLSAMNRSARLLSWHPEGRWLISKEGLLEERLLFREWTDGTEGPLSLPHPRGVESFDLSPDGRRIVTASMDGFVRIWDVKTGRVIRRVGREIPEHVIGPPFPHSVRYSPDGKWLAVTHHGCFEAGLTIHDALTADEKFTWDIGSTDAIAFSPATGFLAFHGRDDRLHLLDPNERKLTGSSPGPHEARTFALAFSRDGTRVAAGGSDGVVYVWDSLSRWK